MIKIKSDKIIVGESVFDGYVYALNGKIVEVSKEDKVLDNKIEIIKIIVADKLAAKERAQKAASQRIQNQRILEIMADKQDAALKEKSIEELQAMLTVDDIDDED